MSFSTGGSKQKASSEPTFKFEGSKDLASSAVNRSRDRFDQDFQSQGVKFLQSLINGEGFNFEPSPTLGRLLSSIRGSADYALPQELAQTRSSYMRAPAGRQALALDDTLLKNRITRDSLLSNILQNQYNTELGARTGAANSLINTDNMNFAQALQALGLVTGNKTTQRKSAWGAEGNMGDVGALGSAFMGMF